MILLDLFGFGFDLVYTEIPVSDLFISFIVLIGIFITYIFRKIFPFNIIWGFLVIVFVYTLLNYVGDKLKKWINSNN